MSHMLRSKDLALADLDFAISDIHPSEKMHTASLGEVRGADLNTRHHIKPSPKNSDLMW